MRETIKTAAREAAEALLDSTIAVYETPAYKETGIDPIPQAIFETGERGDDCVWDTLQEMGVAAKAEEAGIDEDALWAIVWEAVEEACDAREERHG